MQVLWESLPVFWLGGKCRCVLIMLSGEVVRFPDTKEWIGV